MRFATQGICVEPQSDAHFDAWLRTKRD